MNSRRRLVAMIALGAFAGCMTPPSYGYQYRMQQQFGGGEEPEVANAEARQLLASARTVAFFPPDVCLSESGQASTASEQQLRASCGVLLSGLERAAERAGYEVLSWHNLRGNKRPLDFAREANVDVLFEINEFDLGQLDDSSVQRSLSFFERSPTGVDTALQVSGVVIDRCRAYAMQRDPVQAAALTGTVDIKTVSVVDGRSRWHYRKTAAQALGRSYPQITFPSRIEPNKGIGFLGGLGLGAVLIAGTLYLVEQETSNDPATGETKLDAGNWPAYLTIGGVLAMAGAIALTVATKPEAASPDEIMCLDTPVVAARGEVVVGPSPLPMASSITFQTSTQADPLIRERERIRDNMIADFIGVLSEAHRNGTPAPRPAP